MANNTAMNTAKLIQWNKFQHYKSVRSAESKQILLFKKRTNLSRIWELWCWFDFQMVIRWSSQSQSCIIWRKRVRSDQFCRRMCTSAAKCAKSARWLLRAFSRCKILSYWSTSVKRKKKNGPSTGSHVASAPLKSYFPPRPENFALATKLQWPIAVWFLKCSMREGIWNASIIRTIFSIIAVFVYALQQISCRLASISNYIAHRSRTWKSSSIPSCTSIESTRLSTRGS